MCAWVCVFTRARACDVRACAHCAHAHQTVPRVAGGINPASMECMSTAESTTAGPDGGGGATEASHSPSINSGHQSAPPVLRGPKMSCSSSLIDSCIWVRETCSLRENEGCRHACRIRSAGREDWEDDPDDEDEDSPVFVVFIDAVANGGAAHNDPGGCCCCF